MSVVEEPREGSGSNKEAGADEPAGDPPGNGPAAAPRPQRATARSAPRADGRIDDIPELEPTPADTMPSGAAPGGDPLPPPVGDLPMPDPTGPVALPQAEALQSEEDRSTEGLPLSEVADDPIPRAAFEDVTEDALPRPDPPQGGFAPPSIPGIRGEITRPLTGLHSGGSSGEPEGGPFPPVAAPPESGGAPVRDSTEALLDDLAGAPLGEKTVDLDLSAVLNTHDMSQVDSEDNSLTLEGAPFEEGTDVHVLPPKPGDVIPADNGSRITIEESLGDQRGCIFFRARIDDGQQPFTAVWSPDPRPEPPWDRIPDPRIVRPRCRASLERASVRVFDRPKGNTAVDYLAVGDRNLPAMATLELGLELAEVLESLHGAGQYVLDLDPSQIVIERGGRVRLYAINGFVGASELPPAPSGIFAPPEVRRRLSYLVGTHSDVFAVALLVYALLARRSPLDTDLDPAHLCSARVFRPECPLGIWPHLAACLQAQPSKRVGHARGLRQNLQRARERLLAESRAADSKPPLLLEAWAELHTGLGKARRGAPQQDRAVALTDDAGQVGLYVVSDGVSRSKYGAGDYAAEQVEIAAVQRWSALEKAGPAALALSHPQRVDVLRQIARSAGKRISTEVNARCAPVPNEPNQVMSATYVAAYIVDGEATVANLGDSRAYLVRDRTIERISIDHDRHTDALRMGLSFKEAAEVKMGSALTRVVGRVVIDSEGRAFPDPFEPEIFRLQLLPDDRLVLCSDGIPDFAAGAGADQATAEAVMLDTVLEYEDPARASYELVVLANRGGGYDNISCIVIAGHAG